MELIMGKWLLLKEVDLATRVQILDKAVCISHNALAKGMNPTILFQSMGK